MSDDSQRIMVGKHPVSIVGLQDAISSLSEAYSTRTDEQVGSAMVEALEKRNYIPASAREEYAKAFAREFRKTLGQAYIEPAPEGLDIKVLGAGCAQCNQLEQMVMEILSELDVAANLDHVTDMREIARYGVLGVPALLINGRVLSTGSVPPKSRLKSWILDAASETVKK